MFSVYIRKGACGRFVVDISEDQRLYKANLDDSL